MEDLSSLEGPPLQDGRFTPNNSLVSPISPENAYIAYNRWVDTDPGSVSPLTSAARSIYSSSSISGVPVSSPIQPLRNSRSHPSLRDTTDIPPRPASTDNSNNASAPFWLLVNGRLVWIEDLQLWVLWDDVVTSQNLGAYYSQQQQRRSQENQQQQQQQQQQRQSGRGLRMWKSLPPLPHEIHHLLPSSMDLRASFDPNDRIQQRDQYSPQISPASARIQLQWASLAGQLAPHIPPANRAFTRQIPQSLQPAQPLQSQPQPIHQNGYPYYA